ncbi:MAG TPA: hypothetical protein EYG11_16940 [Candidatus Latescibacteria bacterium]|nr:hypothetical protein [Candidatus Latescibacterota bacterium]
MIRKLRGITTSSGDWARFAAGVEIQQRLESKNAELGLLLSDARFRQNLLLANNHHLQAIAALQQVIAVDSTYANAYINLTLAYINLGQSANAIGIL